MNLGASFREKDDQELTLSFLIEKNKFRVTVNGTLSGYIPGSIQSFQDVNVLNDRKEVKGRIFINDFQVLPSIGTVLYKSISSKTQCSSKCLEFS